MRYPPALTFTPGASWVYRAFATAMACLMACAIATIMIAASAYSMPATGGFSIKNGAWMLLAASTALWLLWDAWALPHGQLQYAQGQWHWLHDSQETAGTCALHLDLQSYMLVSFVPHQTQKKFFQTTTQWFHLEARHADPAAGLPAWLALRRAVYAPAAPIDAESAHEQRTA
jgi:hypothetical protein